jgi:hypothetical protein
MRKFDPLRCPTLYQLSKSGYTDDAMELKE